METIHILNKTIHLVATAHVSKSSVEEVERVINEINPDTVCVELDSKRAENLNKKTDYSTLKLSEVIRQKKVGLVVSNYILARYQKQIADQMETNVGDEMRMAITKARETNADIAYIDRDITITLSRIWSHLSLWEKAKLIAALIGSLFEEEEIDESTIEQMKHQDILESSLDEISEVFPTVTEILVYERDAYMAQSIKNAPGTKIVAVVGAAHAGGIKEALMKDDIDLAQLTTIKKPSWVMKHIQWLIPIGLIALVLITTGLNLDALMRLSSWLLFAAGAAAIGALLCLAHPVTILVSFISAPLSTLSPVLAVGWFAGLSEAYFREATVGDFDTLEEDSKSLKKILKNNILRTLLIMVVTSLFSSIVTIAFSFDVVSEFILNLLS